MGGGHQTSVKLRADGASIGRKSCLIYGVPIWGGLFLGRSYFSGSLALSLPAPWLACGLGRLFEFVEKNLFVDRVEDFCNIACNKADSSLV